MNLRVLAGVERVTVSDLQRVILDNRALTAELLREPVVKRCRGFGERYARACATLAAWDGTYDVDSVGAVLWREFIAAYPGVIWSKPFDKSHPVATPRGLAPRSGSKRDPVELALETALARLDRAGIDPYRDPLGKVQFTEKAERRFSVSGAGEPLGVTNQTLFLPAGVPAQTPGMDPGEFIHPATGLTTRGYPVNFGTSFLMVVGFTDHGPDAQAIMTYSASSDPRSPHFADQTAMYSQQQWRQVLFTREAIGADPKLVVQEISGP